MFGKLLIANRGEIAVRIIRACRELGLRSVAVYSEADRDWPHVHLADEAYCLGPAAPAESYLHIGRLLEVARRSGAEAVHPGYGFLSERPDFAQACQEAGLVFVGPSPRAMALLGSKVAARRLAAEAGVPVADGVDTPLADVETALAAAAQLGYPLMLKAVAGGGGKGMRTVRTAEELRAAFRAAASEASTAFGDGAVYLERLIERPRHVEVQFLADAYGQVVALGERECSIQRRHQKLVEEAPSPVVDAALRTRLYEAAVRVARAAGYTNAGTAEFLLDSAGHFFFLEVNARLQVEHPVTELVTGLDLVQEQLRLAAGEPLGYGQEDITLRGHAIECRVYAEDPRQRFLPSSGRLEYLREPSGAGVRVDSGVWAGVEIPLYYDPLLAKLSVWGADRIQACRRLARALEEYEVLGVPTTLGFSRWLARHPDFLAGRLDTGFVERAWGDGPPLEEEALREAALVAALAMDGQRPAARDDSARSDGHAWRWLGRRLSLGVG